MEEGRIQFYQKTLAEAQGRSDTEIAEHLLAEIPPMKAFLEQLLSQAQGEPKELLRTLRSFQKSLASNQEKLEKRLSK